jgi:hypothetical protein
MAQTGYTPISIYYSSTASNTPTAGNLVAGELAINTADGKLFYKDSAGVVQVIAGKGGAGVAGGSNTQVQYNSSGSLAGSANFIFDGTNVGIGISTPSSYSKLSVLGAVTSGEQSSTSGSTLLRGYYGVGALTAIGTEFSSGGPVIGYGVTGSKSAEGSFESTTTANLPRSAFYMDGSSFRFYSATAQTTAIGSTATGMTEYMRLDGNGNLGIGISSPTRKFQVQGDVAIGTLGVSGNYAVTYNPDTTGNTVFWTKCDNYFAWGTGSNPYSGGTERMRLDGNGNLSIGTTSSYAKLTVVGGTGTQSNAYFGASDANLTGMALRLAPSANAAMVSSEWNTVGVDLLLGTGGTERLRVNTSGNILIGKTNDEGGKFQVSQQSTSNLIALFNGDNGAGTSDGIVVTYNGAGAANFRVKAYVSGYNGVVDLRNGSNNLETRITGAGGSASFFGASAGNGNPLAFFGASTQTQVGSIDFFKSGNGAGSSGLITFNASGTSNYPLIFRYNGSDVGYITYTNTVTTYVSVSDYRLKENIAPMTGALGRVAKLNPVTYNWKKDGSEGQGFIAHELAEICPDAVSGKKDAIDEEGNIKPQGIDTSFLVATLTSAIQEQQAIIETLTTRLTALENK